MKEHLTLKQKEIRTELRILFPSLDEMEKTIDALDVSSPAELKLFLKKIVGILYQLLRNEGVFE